MAAKPILLDLVDTGITVDDIVPASSIAHALRAGMRPSDRVFDRLLPPALRAVSSQHWTPIATAARAAEWIDQLGLRRVVDIGSGAGKFCVATALASHATFLGVEQRAWLIDAARELAQTFDLGDQVSFVHGTFGEIPIVDADVYYLYNPFGENLFGPEDQLDHDVELGCDRYRRDITAVESMLFSAPIGTHLLTYNGFGGPVPLGYREVRVDNELPNVLRMWKKVAPCLPGRDPSAGWL